MEFDDLTDILFKKLNFCGCGDPYCILDLILNFIKLSQAQYDETPPTFSGKEWQEYCNNKQEKWKKFIVDNADSVIWFIYYVLNEKGIFSHGGNVRGGRLKDEKFFKLLIEWNERKSIGKQFRGEN